MRPIRTLSLLSLATPLLLAACGHPDGPDPRTTPPLVRVSTAATALTGGRSFTGVVVARTQSDLGFRVGGKVTERLVDAGQVVKRGQPLMKMDPTDLSLADVALNQAVAAARARAVQTASDEKRYRDLVAAGAVSASAYDLAKSASDAASAQLSALQAQEGVAHNQTGYAVLVADADGVVMDTLAEPGQVVAAGQVVVKLARAGAREAEISLPETVRPAVGSKATAQLFSGDAKPSPAVLRQLSDYADPQTRTFDARYVLEGQAANSPLGSTVVVNVPAGNLTSSLSIPLSALYDNGHGPGVWIVAGQPAKVSWTPVKVVSVASETADIASGIHAGDRFITLGAHLLHEGQQVTVDANATGAGR